MTGLMEYRYRALYADGRLESGRVTAATREDVHSLLNAKRLLPVLIVPLGELRVAKLPWPVLALGLGLLANLLQAGLPLERALQVFGATAPDPWHRVLPQISELIKQGRSFGQALHQLPQFPTFVSGLIQAGEAAGDHAEAVTRAAQLAESIASSRRAIYQAMAYPVILLVTGVAALGFLVGIVLPRFTLLITEIGQQLPFTTRLVVQLAAFGGEMLIPGTLTGGVVLLIWRLWTSNGHGQRQWHRLLRQIPWLGPTRVALGGADASEIIGNLLESGVVLPKALELGAVASRDAALRDALMRSRTAILEGRTPSAALSQEAALSGTALKLIRVGEETGHLGQMFREAARFDRREAERRLRTGVQLIEPCFILFFGGLVALVAAALLQALYGVRPV